MKKIICKKEYDTETATLIKAYSYGYYGDPAGYEEDLYQTPAVYTSCTWAAARTPPTPPRTSCGWLRLRSTTGWRLTKRIQKGGHPAAFLISPIQIRFTLAFSHFFVNIS